jgi:hypothetical protein
MGLEAMKARHAAEAITGTEITHFAGLLAFVKAVEPEAAPNSMGAARCAGDQEAEARG